MRSDAMSRDFLTALALVALAAASALAQPAGAGAAPADERLAPPASERLALTLAARGVQIYQCRERAWAFFAPEAELLDAQGRVVGTHGAGPFWQLAADGSRVGGQVKARVDAPAAADIPWLLLAAKAYAGALPGGQLAGVRHIQRINTQGGIAPAGSCVNQQTVRVAYTADYLFFKDL
jgi:Protein of unknown function (DUF3455)